MKNLSVIVAVVLSIMASEAFSQSFQTLDYINKISGKQTLSGHYPGSDAGMEINYPLNMNQIL